MNEANITASVLRYYISHEHRVVTCHTTIGYVPMRFAWLLPTALVQTRDGTETAESRQQTIGGEV